MRIILLFLIGIMMFTVGLAYANVPPVISIQNNSVTGTTLPSGIFLSSGQSITLIANTTQNSSLWHWYVDNVNISNNFNNTTVSFTSGSYHYVVVNQTNGTNASNTIYWGLNVAPTMATAGDQIQLLDESPSQNLESAIGNNSLPELVNTPIQVYVNLIGLSFYAFVWFIVFAMLWIKQKSINIPAVIGIVFGGLIITFLPAQYQLVSQVFIVFGIFSVIYVFYKGRG